LANYRSRNQPTIFSDEPKVKDFQEAGIGGIDLYLACFGPALQVFTEAWPLTRGTARPEPRKKQKDLFEEFDPYAVRPEGTWGAATDVESRSPRGVHTGGNAPCGVHRRPNRVTLSLVFLVVLPVSD
jgi:hypothetical protein